VKKLAGFTLLEVMIALVILAIALTAISKAVSANARNATYIDNKTFAHWAGMNIVAHYQLLAEQSNFTGQYDDQGDSTLLGRKWYWKAQIAPSTAEQNYTIKVTVSNTLNGPAIDTINGFLYHEITNNNS
jgi:general secretion pathway protein I